MLLTRLFGAADADALRDVAQAQLEGRATRVAGALITCGAISSWMGWGYAAGLAALVLAREFVWAPRIARALWRMAAQDVRRARALLFAHVLTGACIYVACWAPPWLAPAAPTAAYFLAAVWFSGVLFHAFIYFSQDRAMTCAAAAPACAAAVVAPFLLRAETGDAAMLLLAVLSALGVALAARQDRTRLIGLLAENARQREAAESAAREKSQFLAVMSHELRTPLNAVIGYAEILEEELTQMPRAAADAGRIRRAARNLLGLINEVLDFSKLEAGKMDSFARPFNFRELAQEVMETAAHIAAANKNQMSLALDPRLEAIVADGGKLRQCLINLLSNACKFTENGAIAMYANLAEDAGGWTLVVSVADTGRGIAAEDAQRLFQPFVQIDDAQTRRHSGAGLGLVITRRLAQLMHGDVTLSSAPGRGSVFTLRVRVELPFADAPAGVEESGEGPLVLVIEDEPASRDLCMRALARLPLRVIFAGTAAEGARIARERAPALILLDLHLPDESGWALLERWRADPPPGAAPVVIVSIEDDRPRAMALGACDHLVKPVDRNQLAAAAMRYLRFPAEAAPPPFPDASEAAA
ncbi:MAG: hybrid sensor histidine kinase/response regulator [Hyphomonadaceae bacterium]